MTRPVNNDQFAASGDAFGRDRVAGGKGLFYAFVDQGLLPVLGSLLVICQVIVLAFAQRGSAAGRRTVYVVIILASRASGDGVQGINVCH
jgi:hypothetical protein